MSGGVQRIPGYCALCVSSCGCISVVKEGRLVAIEPDPSHSIGKALCGRGRAAPELAHHEERLLYPFRLAMPDGAIRARAKLRDTLDPRVVSATDGWWQACTALGLPSYDAIGPDSANINDAIGNRATDPISSPVPHRCYLREVSRGAAP